MTDAEYRAEQQKFDIETQQQIRRIYTLFASGEEMLIKAEQRRMAAEEQRAKEEKQRAEAAEKRSKELDEKLKEVSEDISRLNKECGGIGNNIGSVTEEFFFKAMSTHMRIGTVVFDSIESNARYKSIDGTDTGELDLVLFNGTCVLIIETKYRCHLNDVVSLEDTMSKIQLHAFKEFGAKQLLFGMASEKFNEDAAKYAQKCNMILLYPDGQTICADIDACAALKP